MPTDPNRTAIQIAWINFVMSVKTLLISQPDDRPLDQYLAFRDSVLSLVQRNDFVSFLSDKAWAPSNTNYPQLREEIRNALLLELQAFPLAVEAAHTLGKPEETKSWWRKMLGRGSTITGSVKDLMGAKIPLLNEGLTLFKELIDLFRGKE